MQQAHIRTVATGGKSGDQNLFGPQGVPLWLNYFNNDNLTYAVNNWVGAAAAADRLSSRPTLRVLEIGAGTGSATEILLRLLGERELLPRIERYVVTEPNAYFRRCNQRKLAAQYPNLPLEWTTVDVDLPWSAQGIVSGEFDLVYAVNVMHISKNLLFSLNEARSALAAGGWLVIGECVRPYDNQPMYPELMFQVLDSFTNVETDPEIRPNPGFLTAEQWRHAFSRADFHAHRRLHRISNESARSTRIFLPAPFADKTGQPPNDFGNSQPQTFGSRSLGECARARHPSFAGSDRLDRGTGRPAAGEATVISDHSLLPDHGTDCATGLIRIPEPSARGFRPLVECVASFLLFCHYDSGPRLFVAW